MTTLLLVRHGETDWNRDGGWQGGSDTRLNDLGREQARALADELDGNIDVVYSSDLARARETADIVAAKLQLEVRVDPRLRERSFGSWEGLTTLEINLAATMSDRKSTRLNSSHVAISYAVFCWKKKKRFQINSRQFVDPEFPDLKCLHLLFPRCFQIELDRDKITAQIVGLAGVKETNILPVHRD